MSQMKETFLNAISCEMYEKQKRKKEETFSSI